MTRHHLPRAQRTQTTMRLRTDLLETLGEIAADRGITRSHLVEQALVEFAEGEKGEIRPAPPVNQGDLFS